MFAKTIEYNAKGKPLYSESPTKTQVRRKSKNFSKRVRKTKQKVVSKITKSFTTPPSFKKKRNFKPFFGKKKSKKDILKKYRKFSEKGQKLDFSCKNRTLVKIKKKSEPLKPQQTFSLRKKKLNFNQKSEPVRGNLSASLRRKTSFPRKLGRKQTSLQTPRFKKLSSIERPLAIQVCPNSNLVFTNPISLARTLEKNPDLINVNQIKLLKNSAFQKASTVASYCSKLKQFAIFNKLKFEPWPKSISAYTRSFAKSEIDWPKIERWLWKRGFSVSWSTVDGDWTAIKLCFQKKFNSEFWSKNGTFFTSKKSLRKWRYLPSKEKEVIPWQFFRGFLRFTKNLDFSHNRTYRVNQLSLLFSGLLTLRFSDTERVLISGTHIVSERNPEGGKVDFLQIQIENAKNVSTRREIQTVRVLASHGTKIGFSIVEI